MMNPVKGAVGRITGWAQQTWTRMRQRWPVVDHAWRTKQRYSEVIGSRLAAGSAYYGFFAVFAFVDP